VGAGVPAAPGRLAGTPHYSRGVLRPPSLSRALIGPAVRVLLAGLVVLGLVSLGPTGLTASAAGPAPRDPTQPLTVRIGSITPDYIPDHGPIVIRGSVTNDSDQEWTAINMEAFVGSTPITTTAELAAAAEVPVGADVGHRIADPGTFDTIATLQPGQTAPFSIRLPRSKIPVTVPGVYWFGVHALGTATTGRATAGRDRTFLPYLPASVTSSGAVQVAALVVPVRAGVTRNTDGAIADPDRWARSLRSGPLHAVLTTGRAAGGRPLSWLLDPAVLDVVRLLSEGNPPRTLKSPTTAKPGEPTPSPSASASGSAAGVADDSATAPSTARVARRWLRQINRFLTLDTGQVLGLPYGDLDVGSALRYDRALLRAAIHRTGHTFDPVDFAVSPAVSPPSGGMAGAAIQALPPTTTVVLSDHAVLGTPPSSVTVADRSVVLTSSGAAAGGPGPADPLSPLAARQRILSEAALRFLGDQSPLVVQLPTSLQRRLRPSFFAGLDVPWLRLATVGGATAGPTVALSGLRLRTSTTSGVQLGPGLYARADHVLSQGSALQSVLIGNHVLRGRLFEEVTGNASYSAAEDPFGADSRMRSTAAWVEGNLAGIGIAAPPKVTLASTKGHFSALVNNTLDVPVTVRVRARADPQLKITGGEGVRLPPHGRTTVLLNASTHVLGVHTVTLELTTLAGRPLGPHDTFPIRAEAVSRLIWVIIGAGVGLLFAAIIVRLVRRVVRSRAS
jgi:hypothetical protein